MNDKLISKKNCVQVAFYNISFIIELRLLHFNHSMMFRKSAEASFVCSRISISSSRHRIVQVIRDRRVVIIYTSEYLWFIINRILQIYTRSNIFLRACLEETLTRKTLPLLANYRANETVHRKREKDGNRMTDHDYRSVLCALRKESLSVEAALDV